MPPFRLYYVAVVSLSLLGWACKHTPPNRVSVADEVPEGQLAVPEDFRMVLGQGGGFMSRWDGYTIRSDGAVLSWSGRMAEEGSRPAGALPDTMLREIWRRINEVRLFEVNTQEVGNMTAFIELTAGGRTHRVSWLPSAEGFEPPRSPVDALYRYSLKAAAQAAQP